MEKSNITTSDTIFCSSCGFSNSSKSKFCKDCGAELIKLHNKNIEENLVPKSGKIITEKKDEYSTIDDLAMSTPTPTPTPTEIEKEEEDLNVAVKVLSFCFPFVGGIVYLNHKGSSPKKASAACSCALWGVGIGFLLNIITAIANG